jgi:dTDP-4-amino-4,6-dideoxygalactose transaminase
MKMYSWWHSKFQETEQKALLSAFQNRDFTTGFIVKEFENKFASLCGRKYAVATNSGTSSIAMALLAADLPLTGEVILPEIGWIATLQAVNFVARKPIFVDVCKDRPVLDIDCLKKEITSNTSAIIPVHYNGRMVPISDIKLAAPNAVIIEDCCKAMFSKNNLHTDNVDSLSKADMSCYSFGMISLISATYGGLVATDSTELYEKLLEIRWHGVKTSEVFYEHEQYNYQSFNFKPSGLLFSIANSSVDDALGRIEYLNLIHNKYKQVLNKFEKFGIEIVDVDNTNGEIPLLNDIYYDELPSLIDHLSSNGIETCRLHPPLSGANYLKITNSAGLNSSRYYRNTAHLPSGIYRDDLNSEYFEILEQTLIKYFSSKN